MNFKQLECFIEVCEQLNFTHAAKNMYISQQGLSKTIGVLEDELGTDLFYRTPSSLQLTEYGEFFYPRAKELLKQYNRVMDEYKNFRSDRPGEMRIGIPYGFINIFPNDIIENFTAKYPSVSLKFMQYNDYECDEALLDGSIDIGFCVDALPESSFVVHSTHNEQTLYMLGENHPLAGRQQISLRELKSDRFITFGQQSKSHANFLNRCRTCGFEPNIRISTLDMQMIMQTCRNNGGIGFWTGNPSADIPGIRIIPDSDEAWIWKINIATKRDSYISDNMKAFIECFSDW